MLRGTVSGGEEREGRSRPKINRESRDAESEEDGAERDMVLFSSVDTRHDAEATQDSGIIDTGNIQWLVFAMDLSL